MPKKTIETVYDSPDAEAVALYADVERQEAACSELEKIWLSRREDAKIAKEAYEEAVTGLRKLARARQEQSPLFEEDSE